MINYKIIGEDLQALEIDLEPNQSIRTEAGMMLYKDSDVELESKTNGGIGGIFKRVLTGESLFLTHFKNTSSVTKVVSLAAPYPGRIIPINLSDFGGVIYAQSDSFICSEEGVDIDIELTKRIGAGFFGGEGFILQKITGTGMVFLHSGGTIIEKELNGNQIDLDTGCLVAFSGGIDYDIQSVKGLKNMLLGGEGIFLTKLTGKGKVYIQTLPFSRLASTIVAAGGYNSGVESTNGIVGDIGGKLIGNILKGN